MRYYFILLSIFGTGYGYLGWSLFREFSPLSFHLLALLLLLILFGIILWIPLVLWRSDRERTSQIDQVIYRIAFCSIGFLSFVLVLTVFKDIVSLFVSMPLHAAVWTWAVLGSSLVLFGIGFLNAHFLVKVHESEVPLKDLPAELLGFRIVQISDLHVGPLIRRGFVRKVIEKVNSCRPDLIALTGDLVDGTVQDLKDEVASLSLLTAKYGKYYVTGNHEYYWEAAPWIQEFESLGITPLINRHEVVRVNGRTLVVAGIPDPMSKSMNMGAPDLVKALEDSPSNAYPKILLSHRPEVAPHAEASGYDLQLSGHTHGGQFFPWTIAASLVHPFFRGLHFLGKLTIYVSRGTGYWGPPVRMGSPAEISLLILRNAQDLKSNQANDSSEVSIANSSP